MVLKVNLNNPVRGIDASLQVDGFVNFGKHPSIALPFGLANSFIQQGTLPIIPLVSQCLMTKKNVPNPYSLINRRLRATIPHMFYSKEDMDVVADLAGEGLVTLVEQFYRPTHLVSLGREILNLASNKTEVELPSPRAGARLLTEVKDPKNSVCVDCMLIKNCHSNLLINAQNLPDQPITLPALDAPNENEWL